MSKFDGVGILTCGLVFVSRDFELGRSDICDSQESTVSPAQRTGLIYF